MGRSVRLTVLSLLCVKHFSPSPPPPQKTVQLVYTRASGIPRVRIRPTINFPPEAPISSSPYTGPKKNNNHLYFWIIVKCTRLCISKARNARARLQFSTSPTRLFVKDEAKMRENVSHERSRASGLKFEKPISLLLV